MRSLLFLVLLILRSGAAFARSGSGAPTGAIADAPPVFYQRYPGDGERVGDELELLRENRVRVQHYPPADVSGFNWERDSFTDYTWWMQMQELRFLLPAIASEAPEDQRLARAWFMRWYAVHMVPEPAVTRWGEAMTVGYRAMVLVRLFASEQERDEPDAAVMQYLRSALLAHQQDLSRPARFDPLSNHAFIAALGLFETTRVVADASASALALSRLETMMARAVSPAGVEKEQSPAYHFVVWKWLGQMAGYFESLPGPPHSLALRMNEVVAHMRRAASFLGDHAGRVPPIGDTDSLRVDAASPPTRTLYDPVSGFAIYKGDKSRRDCRYVVFRIPDEHAEMRSHCHNDALAVFFSQAGETILGDSGRYAYSSSLTRKFMLSRRAHNTIVSHPVGTGEDATLRMAHDVTELARSAGPGWAGSVDVGRTAWTRTVTIPDATGTLRVVDTLRPVSASSEASDLVVLWHLGSDVSDVVAGSGRGARSRAWMLRTRGGQRVRLSMVVEGPGKAGLVEARVVRGQGDPLLGWYSPAQGVLRPVSTLVVRVRRDPTVTVTTELAVEESRCETPGRP